MSFAMTTPQFLDGSKDVTRRWGWKFLKPGDQVRAVEKSMGIRKGEKMNVLGVIEIVSVREEELRQISVDDVRREGFPTWAPEQFVQMMLQHFPKKRRMDTITRIEFKRIA